MQRQFDSSVIGFSQLGMHPTEPLILRNSEPWTNGNWVRCSRLAPPKRASPAIRVE